MNFSEHAELVKEYLEDAREFLDGLDGMLMQLEADGGRPDPEVVAEILSQLHTFKGNSGMMGFGSLQHFAHCLEDPFKSIQGDRLLLDPPLLECFMQCASCLRAAVESITPEAPDDPSTEEGVRLLENTLSGRPQPSGATVSRSASPVDHAPTDLTSQESSKTPTAAAAAAGAPPSGNSDTPAPAVPANPGNGSAPNGNGSARDASSPFNKKTNVIRVDFERLDQLMNLMGELVIHRTRLGRIESQFKELLGEKGLTLELGDTAEQIGKVTTELHEAIMRVRMLPIRTVFMRFPRFVRDLAHERGRDVTLQFEGEETELDKTVIDEIGEPLIHLIRNAVDHGIEGPAERVAAGKPAQGTVLIRAYQESSHIIITVEDDGRGINLQKLRERAERMGLLGREEQHQDLTQLIFLPGLSTVDSVTEISGRGLGMEIVKKSLAKINGTVEVESEPGSGTRFVIKLPLTLAIVSALMVEVSGEPFAIPLASVVESMRVRAEDIHLINHVEVTKVRDQVLPLARLSNLFGLPARSGGDSMYAVLVRSSFGQAGLIVDALLGQQEVVIKALDDYVGNAIGIAGATILGDGKVVLIVDVLEIMEKMRHQKEHVEKQEAAHA